MILHEACIDTLSSRRVAGSAGRLTPALNLTGRESDCKEGGKVMDSWSNCEELIASEQRDAGSL